MERLAAAVSSKVFSLLLGRSSFICSFVLLVYSHLIQSGNDTDQK